MRSRSGGELPQLELECLSALWALEPTPVAAVHARLAERGRRLAYTTVLTVLERLLRKNVVVRERRGRAYVYRSLISRAVMRERAIGRVVDIYFESREKLQEYLNGAPDALPAAAVAPPVEAAADDSDAGEPGAVTEPEPVEVAETPASALEPEPEPELPPFLH